MSERRDPCRGIPDGCQYPDSDRGILDGYQIAEKVTYPMDPGQPRIDMQVLSHQGVQNGCQSGKVL